MNKVLKFLEALKDNRVYRALTIFAICAILAITSNSIGISSVWLIAGTASWFLILANVLESPKPEEEALLKKFHIID